MLDLRVHPNQRQSLEFSAPQYPSYSKGTIGRKVLFKNIIHFFLLKIEYQLSVPYTLKMNETYCTSIDYWI